MKKYYLCEISLITSTNTSLYVIEFNDISDLYDTLKKSLNPFLLFPDLTVTIIDIHDLSL